jgi:hypothetical protein
MLTALAAGAAFVALGCEDGPTQTFSAAPPNAGNNWNTAPNPPTAAANASADFGAAFPSTSKTLLCSNDLKRQRWAWMLTQPVQPPRFYAGLDMAKDDLWTGLRIENAEQAPTKYDQTGGGLCQSMPYGFQGTCPSGFGGCNLNAWGNNGEVNFVWNVATHLVDQMYLSLGYTGTMQTDKYTDHKGEKHDYTLGVGDVIRRDGAPFLITWYDKANRALQITDIFNATMATFAQKAGVPFNVASCTTDDTCKMQAPGTTSKCECQHDVDPMTQKDLPTCTSGSTGQCGIANCGKDGNCLIYADGSVTIFGIRPMVIYFQGQGGIPQPALSTPYQIYNFFSKWEPFSNLPQIVKLDDEGAVASGTPIGAAPKTPPIFCKQGIGQTFDDFKANCVQVHGDASDPNGVDTVNLNKVIHSLTHDQEHWTANVLGANQNFTSLKVLNNPDAVVLDTDEPAMGDIAQDWTFDVRARGRLVNDQTVGPDNYTPGPDYDYRGSALVIIEWARLMLNDIARITGKPVHTLGDPKCIGFSGGVPNFQVNQSYGCSGIEGLIVPNAAATWGTVQTDFSKDPGGVAKPGDLDAPNNYDTDGVYVSILKPGDLYGAFCVDGNNMTDCTANTVSIWQNALQHVTRVLGGGDVHNLPNELQDRRYYFRWYGVAYVKYLKAYGAYMAKYPTTVNQYPDGTVGGGLGPSDVMNQTIDMESLFFDYLSQPGGGGAQTYDKFEYVDREFIGKGVGGTYNWIPFDFEYGCDLFGGNQRYDNWFRRMDREEIALYSAMLTDKTHTPGQENNVNITNLFGSIVLGGDPASAISGAWPSWACAVGQAGDPVKNCGGKHWNNAPLDPTNPSGAAACDFGKYATSGCAGTQVCGAGSSYEAGYIQACGDPCDFTTYAASGCKSVSQVCVALAQGGAVGACLDALMDKNGVSPVNLQGNNPHPYLWSYPGAWSRTPFGRGHSPITIKPTDKHPMLGVAKISIPNFVIDPTNPYATGPYTNSPIPPNIMGTCDPGYTASANGVWCNAATNTGAAGTMVPAFTPLAPWLEVQPAVGFPIPIDAQHSQWISGGQIDFTGVLESYIVDYTPWVDKAKPSCVSDSKCNTGYICCDGQAAHQSFCPSGTTHDCVTDDGTVRITGIEGQDFLGQAFLCQDPTTGDILHVGMYDSAQKVVDWLAAHPGTDFNQSVGGPTPSAQIACNIIVIRSPYDNFVDFIVAKANGVTLNIGTGQGQGRVTDIVLWDPSLVQAL